VWNVSVMEPRRHSVVRRGPCSIAPALERDPCTAPPPTVRRSCSRTDGSHEHFLSYEKAPASGTKLRPSAPLSESGAYSRLLKYNLQDGSCSSIADSATSFRLSATPCAEGLGLHGRGHAGRLVWWEPTR